MLDQHLRQLLYDDADRMAALSALRQLSLPDAYIGAGFVRNLVWDHLHGYQATVLNDVDVVYFDPKLRWQGLELENSLTKLIPNLNWQVKNQALMHQKHGDAPYHNIEDAIRRWPELETAIAVRLKENDDIEILAPFGLSSLFAGQLTPNPAREYQLFLNRVRTKNWLTHWPRLSLVEAQQGDINPTVPKQNA